MKNKPFGDFDMANDIIWIIVPIYNAQNTLKKCIESLLAQTYRNIRIVLVDDGSKDSSGKICDDYAKKDGRVQVIHKSNGGSDSARKAGIEILPDDGYTAFCDADDYMPADGIEKLYALSQEYDADFVCATLQKVWKNIKLKVVCTPCLSKRRVYSKQEQKDLLYKSFFGISNFTGYTPTKLYKNTLLKKSLNFECPVKFFQEDIAFNMQIMFEAERVAVMPDVVYYYRYGGGTSRFMPTYLTDCVKLYEFKLRQIEKHCLPEDFVTTTAIELKNELWVWLCMFYRNNKKDAEAVKKEIAGCCSMPQVVQAINSFENDSSGVPGFTDLVRGKNADGIYEMLVQQEKQDRIKNLIKRVMNKL